MRMMKDKLKVKVELIKNGLARLENVDDADYFGIAFKEYISNSSLKYINPAEGGSAASYSNRIDKKSDALELGSAIHKLILEGDDYHLSTVTKPIESVANIMASAALVVCHMNPTKPYEVCVREAIQLFYNYRGQPITEERIQLILRDGKAYYNHLIAPVPGALVLTSYLRGRLQLAVSNILANQRIAELLKPSNSVFNVKHFKEDVITAGVKVSVNTGRRRTRIFKLKCKIDSWSIDFDNKVITLNDLKTTSSPIQGFMDHSFQKWHYQRQMGMYAWLLKNYCIQEYNIQDIDTWTMQVNMIVAETQAPYNAYTFEVEQSILDEGVKEMEGLLGLVAWHTIKGFDKVIELV
jgi:hypothetical protein